MLQKIPLASKNASNKNCPELNFPQNSQWTYMSVSPFPEWSYGLQRLLGLKYYNAQEWENRFTLRHERCKKYRLYQKMLQMKTVQN